MPDDCRGRRKRAIRRKPDVLKSVAVVMRLAAVLLAVVLVPARLGFAGASVWQFLGYTASLGVLVSVCENPNHARELLSEPAIRQYTLMWVLIVASIGLVPFLIGSAVAD